MRKYLIALSLLLTSCGDPVFVEGKEKYTDRSPITKILIQSDYQIYEDSVNGDIKVFLLPDGTRCAIYKFEGGIDCDWK